MKILRNLGKKFAMVIAAGATCLSLAGCTDFKKAWAEEVAKPDPKRTDLTGAWEGTWKSNMNGHSGKLRAIVTEQAEGQYEFHYWAQWQKVLSGSFRQTYEVTEDKKKAGTFRFSGDKDLGKMGGKFSHTGIATATTFKATYDSEMGDKGTFELTRPEAKPVK